MYKFIKLLLCPIGNHNAYGRFSSSFFFLHIFNIQFHSRMICKSDQFDKVQHDFSCQVLFIYMYILILTNINWCYY